jgi:Tfp pilus assembly protein PilN
MYRLKSEADVETIRLQTELSGVSQELHQARLVINEAKQIEDTIGKITTDFEALKQEHQYILSKGGNAADNLELVTTAIPPEVYFTSIEMGTDQITIDGEADSPSTVIDYVMALEAQGGLSEVRIAGIDESKSTEAETTEAEGTKVTFTIVITK